MKDDIGNAADFPPTRNIGRHLQIAVIGDGEAEGNILKTAEDIGGWIAKAGAVLITGGHGGVMEAACRGAAANGGTCVGILRSGDLSRANTYCNVVIGTEIEHARNVLTVLSSDAVIAVGGGAGTLSEICFAWIHARPIFILRGFGGWSDRLDEIPLDTRRSTAMHFYNSVDELFAALTLAFRVQPRPL
jgi:uncharacterized protein (TIGR00725 family)